MRYIYVSLILIFMISHFFGGKSMAQTNFDLLFGAAKDYQDVVIKKVLSVDTFLLESKERIRLIGIRGPELPLKKKQEREQQGEMGFIMERGYQEVSPVDSIETIALDYTKQLLENKHVRLEFDVLRKSDDHRTLAYVYLNEDDTFVNAEILRQGYANLSIQPPNTKHAEKLREAYKEAREERRGLQGE